MTTAQDVFDIAMGLMDEMNIDTTGTVTVDTKEYLHRTLPILTALRGELYPYSDTYVKGTDGKRPICPAVTDFETPIGLDDFLAQTILPYGLAAHLLLDENPGAASFFQQRYQELIGRYASSIPAMPEAIVNLYGGFDAPSGKDAVS